jgi:hypothetical protein
MRELVPAQEKNYRKFARDGIQFRMNELKAKVCWVYINRLHSRHRRLS